MTTTRHLGARIAAILLAGAVFPACLTEADPYFPDPSQAPVLERIGDIQCEAGTASEEGLAGGKSVTLYGSRLNGQELSVRFGDRTATILPFDQDDAHITVLSPPGPVRGGSVDVVVSHAGGVTVCRGGYTYLAPDAGTFDLEAGSLELIGYAAPPGGAASHEGALDFWADYRPRQAGSMLPAGSLFFLPYESGETISWPTSAAAPEPNPYGTVEVVDQVSLLPDGQPDQPAFTFALDPFTGDYRLCPGIDGIAPTFQPGTRYRLSATGGVLPESLSTLLDSPPAIVTEEDGGKLPGLKYDVAGRLLVNQDQDLVLQFGLQGGSQPDASYLLVELAVDSAATEPGGALNETARLVARADEDSGVVRISSLELQALGMVDSDDPPMVGLLRMTHHHLYKVKLEAGVAGCAEPGSCVGESYLVVDLVTAYEVPAWFAPFYIFACEDDTDNDQDGLIDGEDPGCDGAEDDDEKDQSGALACDNGVDDDGDGAIDLQDPGCVGAGDSSELGAPDALPCDDGFDNDGDGLIDFRLSGGDPGCDSSRDDDERSAVACDDGEDNDGDGDSDYRPGGGGDPGCQSVLDAKETDDLLACDDGADNEGDGLSDFNDPGCYANPADPRTYSQFESDELNDAVECDDGLDNDGDGAIDYRVKQTANGDRQCKDPFDASETLP